MPQPLREEGNMHKEKNLQPLHITKINNLINDRSPPTDHQHKSRVTLTADFSCNKSWFREKKSLKERKNGEILEGGLDGSRTLTRIQNVMRERSMENFEADLLYRC